MTHKSSRRLAHLCAFLVCGAILKAQGPHRSSDEMMTASELDAVTEEFYHDNGPFELKADALQQSPSKMAFAFPEDVWLVGYRAEITDAEGNELDRELQCHSFLGTSAPQHMHHAEDIVGIFSDGYTNSFRFPSGFGLLLKAGEKVIWDPLFNNRSLHQTTAAMRMTLSVIRAAKLRHPLKPLSMAFRTIQFPDLYYVEPGEDIRESTFQLPAGTIHAMGTHIHPYGVSIEVINLTRNQPVWKAFGARNADGRLMSMPTYRNPSGYEVGAADRFKLVAVYENPTDKPVDAMAGIFIFYSPAPQLTSR